MNDASLPEAEDTRKALIKLFQNTRSESFTEMASVVLYRGNDKERNWKVFADPSIEDDLNYLNRIGKRIKRYQDESEGYTFSEFYTEDDRDGQWFVWEVLFKMGPDQRRCYFRFKKVNNRLGLGDIDS